MRHRGVDWRPYGERKGRLLTGEQEGELIYRLTEGFIKPKEFCSDQTVSEMAIAIRTRDKRSVAEAPAEMTGTRRSQSVEEGRQRSQLVEGVHDGCRWMRKNGDRFRS
jgi:hypothetical protein